MWNSKSCPEGLPHQKNGMIASRQTPASSNAREIGVLSSLSFTLMLCRDAACRVSRGRDGGSPVSADRAILLHGKILGRLTEAKSFSKNGDVVSDQRGGTDYRGLDRHERRGAGLVPGFCKRSFVMERTFIGWGELRPPGQPNHPSPRKARGLGTPARAAVPTFRLVIIGSRRPDFAGAAVRRETLLPPAQGRSAAIPAGDRPHRFRRSRCG